MKIRLFSLAALTAITAGAFASVPVLACGGGNGNAGWQANNGFGNGNNGNHYGQYKQMRRMAHAQRQAQRELALQQQYQAALAQQSYVNNQYATNASYPALYDANGNPISNTSNLYLYNNGYGNSYNNQYGSPYYNPNLSNAAQGLLSNLLNRF